MVMVTLYGHLTYFIPSTESIDSHAMGILIYILSQPHIPAGSALFLSMPGLQLFCY